MKVSKTRNEREDRKSWMEQLKKFWRKQVQKGKFDKADLTTVSRQRPCWGKNHRLKVHEKRRLYVGRWDGKRTLCSPPSKVQLAWNLLSSTKSSLQKNEMTFFFRTNVQNICFSCLIPKMILFGGSQESQVPPANQVKKSSKWIIWAEWQAAVSLGFILYPKDRLWLPTTASTTYQRKKWSRFFAVKMRMKQ